jgi:hypothetical protein
VFTREIGALVAMARCEVSPRFLPKGLHNLPSGEMLARVQAAVDQASAEPVDAVVMAYGLCNRGLAGITARNLPLVIPRAHDCISVFLGSAARHRRAIASEPGTYFLTSGWIERSRNGAELEQLSIARRMGLDLSREQLVEKYGEENAEYISQQLGGGSQRYTRLAYIPMGVEPDDRFERAARQRAQDKGWRFETVTGDISVLRRLLDGDWDDAAFQIVRPGEQLGTRHDDRVMCAEPAAGTR